MARLVRLRNPLPSVTLFVLVLVAAVRAQAQKRAQQLELRAGTVITRSARIAKRTYRLPADVPNDSGVIVIRGSDITVDFGGATLEGMPAGHDPDLANGIGIRVEGGRNVRIVNARIRGYKIGILARGTTNLTIERVDASNNWKPRLFSLIEHESLVDWLSYHQNEKDEWLRYGAAIYLRDVARGDLGDSLRQGRPVTQILVERLPVTIELALTAMLFATTVGIPLGIISARRRNSAADVATMIGANLGVSTPVFVLGLLLEYLFAVLLKDTFLWLPPSGRLDSGVLVISLAEAWHLESWTGLPAAVLEFFSRLYLLNGLLTGNSKLFLDTLRHLILPAIAVGTIPLAIIARMTRSSMLEVLHLDYIRAARAKGVPMRGVLFRHGLRNALLPVATVIGLSLGGLLSGAVLTETVFNLAGIGRTLFESITARDYTVVQAFTLAVAIIYVMVNLVVDLVYVFLDPRIRLR